MARRRVDRVDREWERAVLFGLVEPPSRRTQLLTSMRRWALAIPIAILTMLGAPAAAAMANTYFVSNGNDSGTGSLRAAIFASNSHPGADTITLAPGVGALTISLKSAVPRIGQEVVVDFLEGDPDHPIVINDAGNGGTPIPYGLVLAPGSSGSTIEGVEIEGAGSAGLLVQSGDNAIYYFFSHNDGKHGLIVQGSNNTIGGVGANTIDGSSGAGILIQGAGSGVAAGNLVVGNTIGTDTLSDPGLGNLGGGVLLLGNSTGNTIGGSVAGDGNLISGNGVGGVILEGAGITGNLVEGNTVGLTKDGSGALANKAGVVANEGASNDTFTFNTISGNTGSGVVVNGAGSLQLQGNYIGTDPSGTLALGNGGNGVVVEGGGTLNTIGGSVAGDGNLISGNHAYGVQFLGGGLGENTAQGNQIGTTPSGSSALPNQWGVGLTNGAVSDTLTANTISGNADGGVLLSGTGTNSDSVTGNLIGTDTLGTAAVPNKVGVELNGGAGNDSITANEISGNLGAGVQLGGSGTSGNGVTGNFIGTDGSGDALGNGSYGVLLTNGAANNAVGGTAAGDGNTIAFNTNVGVVVNDSVSIGNSLLGNSLFSNGANRTGPGIRLLNGGNGSQVPPAITSIQAAPNGTMISGRALAGARVEAFANSSCLDPEGKQLLAAATADSAGSWSMLIPAVQSGSGVTATQTAASSMNTSQFSRCANAP